MVGSRGRFSNFFRNLEAFLNLHFQRFNVETDGMDTLWRRSEPFLEVRYHSGLGR